jgi:ATP-dependent DNA helicase RecQ
VVLQRRLIDSSEGDLAHRRRQAAHLDSMLALCETIECRRAQMLGYFGEPAEPCGNCDTCLSPVETWDGTIAAQKLLSAVLRLHRERRQRYGAGQVIDILLGKMTPKVIEHDHGSLTVFGIGADLREAEWRGVIRQLLAQRLLAVIGDYGTLALTEASGAVLSGQRQVLLRREQAPAKIRSRSSRAAAEPAAALPSGAADLFERLRSWRTATAREQGVPAYVIFHDATLREFAARQPASLSELAAVGGVGEAKLAKYGDQIIRLLHDREGSDIS